MFTGIVTALGEVRALDARDGGARLEVAVGDWAADAELGESISVSGACLTLCARTADRFAFDLSSETLQRTTLGALAPGAPVNLERALAVGDRLGGHIVSGHIDGLGRVLERRRDGNSERFTFALPDDGSVRVIEKGSIAVDGISLTSWDCRGARFSVAVIPHTLQRTTLGSRRVGDRVNLEQDQVGRWIAALAEPWRGG